MCVGNSLVASRKIQLRNDEKLAKNIESQGIEALKNALTEQGRMVEKSDKKTFDLKVDGRYAEVKTKSKPYSQLDFLSFTDNQFDKILVEEFLLFLVCNVACPEQIEIFEFESIKLRNVEPKKYTSYEFNKSVIDRISKIKRAPHSGR